MTADIFIVLCSAMKQMNYKGRGFLRGRGICVPLPLMVHRGSTALLLLLCGITTGARLV